MPSSPLQFVPSLSSGYLMLKMNASLTWAQRGLVESPTVNATEVTIQVPPPASGVFNIKGNSLKTRQSLGLPSVASPHSKALFQLEVFRNMAL